MSYHALHIAKFQENLSTQFVLKCKSGKNFADFTIFSCVSSHISTLAHRNFTKLTQKFCLIMFYIIAKFQENLSTQFVLKCKSGKNFADFTIFPCVSSHISTLAHRNFTKLTQKLCLIMFYIIAKFQENRSAQFVLKCKSGKNCSSSPLKYLSPNSTFLRKEKKQRRSRKILYGRTIKRWNIKRWTTKRSRCQYVQKLDLFALSLDCGQKKRHVIKVINLTVQTCKFIIYFTRIYKFHIHKLYSNTFKLQRNPQISLFFIKLNWIIVSDLTGLNWNFDRQQSNFPPS